VKAKPAKSSKASQSASKPKAMAKKVARPAVSKPVVKAAAKAKPKPVPKPAAKSAAKSAPKSAAKSVVKKPSKPAVKAKPIVKKSAAKTLAKAPPAKAKAPVKAVAKTRPETAVKPTPKLPAKAIVKPPAKAVAKDVAKVVLKPVKIKPMPVVISKKVAAASVPPALVAQPKSALASNGLPPPPPLKPGRRSSSRALAHMPPPAPMVPTHAPDAAKASYSTMTERVIAPPPHVAAKKDPKLANNWKTKTAETLTDEEVKAMPDAEYMNDKQMAFFRHRLSILKQDIHNSAGATTEHLREDTSVVPDPADRATIEEEHALELRTRDRERKLLKKIEQSIARIDSGDYGYCDETGEPIGVGRLIARPTASLSLEAQQRRELKQKMFGD
jgi:DnaK suppressor protein